MRKIVYQFIESPRPALRKKLTTMELKYALAEIEKRKESESKKTEKSSQSPNQNN